MWRKIKWLSYCLGSILVVISCQDPSDESGWDLKRIKVINTALKENARAIEFANRTKLIYEKDTFYLLNLLKTKELLFVNLSTGEAQKNILMFSGEPKALHYTLEECLVMTEDSVFCFQTDGSLKEVYPNPLASDEFVKHSVCEEAIHRWDDYFYVQLGSTQDQLNYVADSLLLFFNRDTSFRRFQYPAAYQQYYLQYSYVCSAHDGSDFIFLPALTNQLTKQSLTSTSTQSIAIDPADFLVFDTTKFNDVLYVHEFSNATRMNKLLKANEQHYFLIQKLPEAEPIVYRCLVFDHDLQQVNSFEIVEPMDINLVVAHPQGIASIDHKNSSILLWSEAGK